MSLAFKRLKVYLRVAVVVALASVLALVLYKNRDHRVAFWFFGITDEERKISVVLLLWTTAGATLIVAQIVRFMRGLVKDLRDVRRMKAEHAAAAVQASRAAELDERERLLTEKLAAHSREGRSTGEATNISAQGGANESRGES